MSNLAGWPIPLARDLTTPLVRRLAQRTLRRYEYISISNPQFYATHAGIYALDAYQPGKVPLVLVHGFWSSPEVWVPMLDILRSDPVLRAAYQFWVVLYPSGYPLPLAALSLRQSLREIRQRFDPHGLDRALDHMVILGKSTGGQVARMLVQSSGEVLWDAVFSRPVDQICATPSLRTNLSAAFFFEPEPYIRRAIFITTSHRGTRLARWPGVRLSVSLVRWNHPFRQAWNELTQMNGGSVFRPSFQNRPLSSVDGLTADSPLLTAIDSQSIAPPVTYHSIIADIKREMTRQQVNDGVVAYESAHLGGAASEYIVRASHACEADPDVIHEVRRILHLHLAEWNTVSQLPVACRAIGPRLQLKPFLISAGAAMVSDCAPELCKAR
jgi:pimeloyl-ACP methyl ester carboxylesterase